MEGVIEKLRAKLALITMPIDTVFKDFKCVGIQCRLYCLHRTLSWYSPNLLLAPFFTYIYFSVLYICVFFLCLRTSKELSLGVMSILNTHFIPMFCLGFSSLMI